jgi:hypothetical protein
MTRPSAHKPMPHPGYLAVIRTIDRFAELTAYLFVIVIVPLAFGPLGSRWEQPPG